MKQAVTGCIMITTEALNRAIITITTMAEILRGMVADKAASGISGIIMAAAVAGTEIILIKTGSSIRTIRISNLS